MTADITKLVTLILGISVAGDRLVTLVKSIFPQLAAPPAGTSDQPPESGKEIAKKVILMVIAFLCCLVTALLFPGCKGGVFKIGDLLPIDAWVIALLASGGSAFWTNILGYLSSLKDLKIQQAALAKYTNDAQLTGGIGAGKNFSAARSRTKVVHRNAPIMKTVRFTAAFSGGDGELHIQIGDIGIDLMQDGFKEVELAEGRVDFTVWGAASPGPNGGAILTINGVENSNSPIKYGPGRISNDNQIMSV